MKRLLRIAALLVAVSLAGPAAYALDEVQAKKIKKTVSGATLPEMPEVVAQLVTQASKSDREAVAVTAVEAAISKNPSSAPVVIAALAKAAPDVKSAALKKAIQLEPSQSATLAIAANRGGNSSRGSAVIEAGANGNSGSNSGRGNAKGHFAEGEHNPGPPLPNSPPHHNRPPHPLGGPPGLVDYSKPRPHH
jgi:hypothetical protein